MLVRQRKSSATLHITMLVAAVLLLAALATIIIIESSSKRGADSAQAIQPVGVEVKPLRTSVPGLDAGITFAGSSDRIAPRSWGLGVGLDPGTVRHPAIQRSWGLGVGFDQGMTSEESPPLVPNGEIGPTEH